MPPDTLHGSQRSGARRTRVPRRSAKPRVTHGIARLTRSEREVAKMREYDVTKCECEACEFDHALMEWTRETEGFTRLSEPLITTWRTVTGCSECMNRLGTSEDGRPWRERMVPEEKANAA